LRLGVKSEFCTHGRTDPRLRHNDALPLLPLLAPLLFVFYLVFELIMAVHSIHIFDRRGKTLFTKRYAKSQGPAEDAEQQSEQRKLVFGMLFSLRELVGSLAPESTGKNGGMLKYS
jgi:hypothetical protein